MSKIDGGEVMLKGFSSSFLLIGRLMLATVFFADGIFKIMEYPVAVQYFVDSGWSQWASQTVVIISIIVELLFSFFLAIGWWVRFSALVLAIYTICVISMLSNFWHYSGSEMWAGLIDFLKGLAIAGGLFQVIGSGSGWFACDFLCHGKKSASE